MELKLKRAKSLNLDTLCVRLEKYVNKRFARSFQREYKDKVHFFRYQQIIDIMDLFFIFNNYEIPKSILLNIFEIQSVQLDRDLSLCNSLEAPTGKKKFNS